MDLSSLHTDEDIVRCLELSIGGISLLDECRLFREEQLQLTEEVIWHRNCVEWAIRANGVIQNTKYALKKSLSYSKKMQWPTEETENKTMYSYYLEDAVYRDIVLWDIFRQLLNEFYKCGCAETEMISIFKFLQQKNNILGDSLSQPILKYLNSEDHQKVRTTLRNSFTHSVESTSSYIFHRVMAGEIQAETNHLLPNHPFENINDIINDMLQLTKFMENTISELKQSLCNKIAFYRISITFPCGKIENDDDSWNLYCLHESAERIIAPCSTPCANSYVYKEQPVCKPIYIQYCRIHSQPGEYSGDITPHATFHELEELFLQE